jgi:type VI secretion system secreted protein VgrG
VASVTVLSYDYKTKPSVSINVPSKFPIGGKNAQSVESFDCPGQYSYTGAREARRYGELRMEGHEALSFVWQGRSTVRTLRAGTRIAINDIPMKAYRDTAPNLTLVRVASVGVNYLPVSAKNGLAELFWLCRGRHGQPVPAADWPGSAGEIHRRRYRPTGNCRRAVQRTRRGPYLADAGRRD